MGMFDYIRCEYPLPGNPPACFQGAAYQTKDLDCDLKTYVITAEGKLTLDDQACGFTGTVEFYTTNIVAGGPGPYTKNGEDARHVTYRAVLLQGGLVSIEEIENRAERAVKFRPRPFPALTESERAALKARRAERLRGRTIYVWWGGQEEGYDAIVVAENDRYLVVQKQDERGDFEILNRGSRDSTFFDSYADGQRDRQQRAAAAERERAEYEAAIRESGE